ncbi:MAG: hypothetical protein WD397_09390 [Wenzhouxiangellaceae bacterium]
MVSAWHVEFLFYFQLQRQLQNLFRRQLRWLMRVTFFDCKKVTKNALYKRQLFEVAAGGVGWLGVSHRAPAQDLSVRLT